MQKNGGACAPPFFRYSRKTLRGGRLDAPPLAASVNPAPGRVNRGISRTTFLGVSHCCPPLIFFEFVPRGLTCPGYSFLHQKAVGASKQPHLEKLTGRSGLKNSISKYPSRNIPIRLLLKVACGHVLVSGQ